MPRHSSDGRKQPGKMPYRVLGRTKERVSCMGLGGSHIGKIAADETIRLIQEALDRGMNFLDNSWDYNNGESELRMGLALKKGWRAKAFLMTKFDGRSRKEAQHQIDESLRRLRTDHVDLLQFHELIRFDDVDRFFAKDGAAKALLDSREAGKTRYIGFTGHKHPAIHLHMLDTARAQGFRFDTVQMPLNVMDAHFRSFEKLVLPRLIEDQIGVLGMKSLAGGVLLKSKTISAEDCLRYALNLPVSVVITGIDSQETLDQAFRVASAFEPIEEAAVAEMLEKTRAGAMSGRFELFKTSTVFDSTVQHPEWLGEDSADAKTLSATA